MPDLNSRIENLVEGDSLQVRRTINRADSGYASGVVIVRAWFTCKVKRSDPDVSALFQKDISTTNVPGTGQIENNGAGDADFVVRFDLVPTNTILIGRLLRHYDIQVKTASGDPYTPERGRINTEEQVTITS